MGGIPTAPLGPSCSWQMAQGSGHAAALQERREVLGTGNFPLPDPGRQPRSPHPASVLQALGSGPRPEKHLRASLFKYRKFFENT